MSSSEPVAAPAESGARQTWYPPGRRFAIKLWSAFTLLAAIAFSTQFAGDRNLVRSTIWFVQFTLGGFGTWLSYRQRVSADERGLTIVRELRTTHIPWADVEQIEPDATPPWGQHLVVVSRDGEVVRTPLPAAPTQVHLELLARWAAAPQGSRITAPSREED